MNYIYLLLFFEIILFLLAFMVNKNDIMAPSAMMCVMFIVSTLFAIVNVKSWNIKYRLDSCLIISSGLFVFLLAETFYRVTFGKSKRKYFKPDPQKIKKIDPHEETDYVQKWMVWAIIIFDLFALVAYFLRLRSITGFSGFNPLIFSTYRSMVAHVESFSDTDVEQVGFVYNQLLRLVRTFGFPAEYIIIKNLLEKQKFRRYAGMLVIVVLSASAGLIVASRMILLQLIVAATVEYTIVWHQKYGWGRNLSWKIIRIAMISLFVGIPVFHFSAEIIGESTNLDAFGYASIYLGSSIQLFNLYVQNPTKPVVFGEETFVGIRQFFDKLGLTTYTRDMNLEFRSVSKGMFSNVYTFFRRPLHDFGYGGMLIFTILVALLFAWLYYGKIKWTTPNRKVDGWILLYGYLYFWVFAASILQVSELYISFNTFATVLPAIIIYRIMTGVKISSRDKTLVIARSRRILRN